MDLDIFNVSIFDGHDVLPETRISIRNGVISEIGAGPAQVPAERVIDGTGKLLTPGFVDAHVHTAFGGMESLGCDLSECLGLEDTLRTIAEALEKTDGDLAGDTAKDQTTPTPRWLTGGGWSMSDFPGGAPLAETLDGLSTERPIILISRDHHSAWVNSAAMAIAGLDADTVAPDGGVIERYADGNPSGCLHESAMDLVSDHVPPASDEEVLAGVSAGQTYLNGLGVTAWMDAIIGDYSGHRSPYDAYLQAAQTGALTSEVIGSLWWGRDVEDIDAEVARLVKLRETAEASAESRSTGAAEASAESRDDSGSNATPGSFTTNSVKFMLDGIVESRTAAMTKEYSCACGGFGTSYFTREHLHSAFAALDTAGFDIHCHAIGDAAVKAALDAFESIPNAAQNDTRSTGPRHHIAHVQVVDPADIPRFAALGITANLQALWACHDQQMIDLNIPCLGEERTSWLYPFRSFRDTGAHLAMGSDWPVSTANPWEAIHVAVNRSHPHDGDPKPLLPEQAIDVRTALRAYTAGSAHLLRSKTNGRIRLGEPANLALASANAFAINPPDIVTITNELTICAGEIVHDATAQVDATQPAPDDRATPAPDDRATTPETSTTAAPPRQTASTERPS